jgi:hypothetical protein
LADARPACRKFTACIARVDLKWPVDLDPVAGLNDVPIIDWMPEHADRAGRRIDVRELLADARPLNSFPHSSSDRHEHRQDSLTTSKRIGNLN